MTEPNAPWFFTSKTARPVDRTKIVSVPTGIPEMDKMIRGLNKGEISCVSGLNSSGKSTWLSQMSLDIVQAGYKVALFSGELKESRVFEWLHLPAAGSGYTNPTKYENFYFVKDEIKYYINEWLEQKLFVYNNAYGAKIDTLLTALEDCITRKKVDIVIMDNLMSINLGANSYNKNDKQTEFIFKVKEMAEKHDVHIVLIAHPRKTIGFLRKDDIAGTADLTNAVDNVFIIHRVDSDFKRLTQQTLSWKSDHLMYEYDNVIEICKNRDLGYKDKMIGLHFDVSCKRFMCDGQIPQRYGWEDLHEQARGIGR